MKAMSTKKTLKAAAAALGVVAVLVLPTGCATTVATCTVNVLGDCV